MLQEIGVRTLDLPRLLIVVNLAVWLALVTIGLARQRRWATRALFLSIVGGSSLWAMLTPRASGTYVFPSVPPDAWKLALDGLQILGGVAVVAAILRIALQGMPRLRAPSILFGYLGIASAALLSTAFAPHSVWSRDMVLGPLFLGAAVILMHNTADDVAGIAGLGLFVVMIGSLASILVNSNWAFVGSSLVPWLPGRLAGLTTHPNSLGGLAVLELAVAYWTRRRVVPQWLLVATAGIVLLLTQSKTAWITAIVVFVIIGAFRGFRRWSSRARLAIAAGALGLAVVALLLLVGSGVVHLAPGEAESLSTFTGRTTVWAISLQRWQQAPLLGYGQVAWGEEWRTQYGLAWAGQAHNQLLETLDRSGVIGAMMLVALIWALLQRALFVSEASRGVSLAVVSVLLLRCITEAPLRIGVFGSTYLFNLVIILLLTSPLSLHGLDNRLEPRPARSQRSSSDERHWARVMSRSALKSTRG